MHAMGVTWWGEMFSVELREGKEERFRICDFLSNHIYHLAICSII